MTGAAQDSGQDEAQTDVLAEEPFFVTVTNLSENSPFYLDLIGTVAAESQVMVYPAVNGQVETVNIEEGDYVSKGDVIYILTGVNEVDHPIVKQYEMAQVNYESAQKLYSTTVASTESALKSAELQVESARHQTSGSYIDYQALAKNIETSQDGIGLIRNSLGETSLKNERDLVNMMDKIEDMENAIDDFDDTRRDILDELMDKIDDAPDETTREALEKQLDATKDELSAKRDELENGLDELKNGYDALQSGTVLTENQLLGQLQQAQNQEHQLYMTADSMQWKLGLFDGTSDPVKMAEQGLEGARAQASAARTQAETALKLAGINLELAANQKKYLLVKAPVGGAVSAVNSKTGDIAAPQAPMAQITATGANTLKVAVDAENAQYISKDSAAEILIGGKYIKVPVKSVSPLADPASKMVMVTLELPKISLRPNQTLQTRLSVNVSNENGDGAPIMVPLDAVTIGTENQFLFVLDGNKAKKTDVELGEIHGSLIEIKQGLSGNEEVIVTGAKEIRDGQEVTIN